MSLKRSLLVAALSFAVAPMASAQLFWNTNGTSATWTATNWGTTAGGPFTSGWTANSNASFTANSAITYVTNTNIGNVNVADGVTVTVTQAGTLGTNGAVRTFTVGSGSTLTWQSQGWSTAAGVGFIKDGPGVWDIAAQGNALNASNGGFTLNAGTVIVSGNNSFGGAASILTINGGTIQSSGGRTYANNIVVGGNFENTGTGTATFSGTVNLGSATRTITNNTTSGGRVYSGVISNSGSGGLTFAGSGAGTTDITNTANTFTGDININGGEVRFTADGSFGNAANNIIIDGGRLATLSGATYTLGAARNIFVGDGLGTSISTPGAGVFTYNNPIQNKTGETGSWAKQGGGTLELGGVSTYTGNTSVNNGILRLTSGSNRLPTGTTLSLGQAASPNVGTFDLNGLNQEVAGLNSTTGTNATVNKNTITSTAPATLTFGGSGTYSYGDGSPANSGVITGAIALIKSGAGSQTLGDANTYTGGTTVSGGTLFVNNTTGSGTGSGTVLVQTGGTLGGSGSIAGSTTVTNGILAPGNSAGTLTFGAGLALNAASILNWELDPLNPATIGGGVNDLAAITGDLLLDGTLNVTPTSGSFLGLTSGTWALATYTGTLFDNGLAPGSLPALDPGYNWTIAAGSGTVTASISAIPEPSTMVLGSLGMLGLAGYGLRRRRASQAS